MKIKTHHSKTCRCRENDVKRKGFARYLPPPRVMEIKAKINKWELIKFKSFCTMKETISKVKRQSSEWEKIIANKKTDKESPKYTSSSCSSIPEKLTTQSKSGPKN